MCLGLGFERLVTIDILIYGTSLVLEFVALIVLRVREPHLPRAFKVPGGMLGVIMIGVCPTLLLAFSIFRSDREQIFGMSSVAFGCLLMAAGVVAYGLDVALRRVRPLPPEANALE
jgi:amino acid transporter